MSPDPRVRRWWIKGSKAGTSDIFIQGLPGYPDNLTIDAAGRIWIALVTPRDAEGEALANQPEARLQRYVAAATATRAPASHHLAPSRIVALDAQSRLLGYWAAPYPELGNVTSVTPTAAGLVLGTNKGSHLGLVAWPLPSPEKAT